MNLDEQLRAALTQEADMQKAPLPDVDRLISGGQVRRRRRNVTRFVAVAAATVLIGGAAYGVTQIDRGNSEGAPGPATEPTDPSASAPASVPPAYVDTDGDPLEPGTYRKYVGAGAAGATIEADLTFEAPGWSSGSQPTISEGDEAAWAGVGIYQVLGIGSGCSENDATLKTPADTPQGLAHQLATLPRSTVLQAPTQTQAFGHSAFHLRLRIEDRCPDVGKAYRVAETPVGSRGISYSDVSGNIVIDFLVVDVDGTAVVVDLCHQAVGSAELVDSATEVRDSITFVTGE